MLPNQTLKQYAELRGVSIDKPLWMFFQLKIEHGGAAGYGGNVEPHSVAGS
jgi:hypothetical protein